LFPLRSPLSKSLLYAHIGVSSGDSTSDSSENDMDSKNKDEDSSDVGSDEELPSEGGNEKTRKNDRQLSKDLIKEIRWQKKGKYTGR
jgi:hypothetical protein